MAIAASPPGVSYSPLRPLSISRFLTLARPSSARRIPDSAPLSAEMCPSTYSPFPPPQQWVAQQREYDISKDMA